jgi:CRP-like cAMP-binding protein
MRNSHGSPILERWLSQQWLFADTDKDELAPLFIEARGVRYLAGSLIYRAGDASDKLYLLTAGKVKIAALDHRGQQIQVNMPAPGLFGEMGVLDGQPRAGAAIAVDSSTAYVVPAAAFHEVLQRSPTVMIRMLALLAGRLRRNSGLMAELPATARWERVWPGANGPETVSDLSRSELRS